MDWKSIIEWLVAQKMTQAQIAERCGARQATISDLAMGETKNPRYPLGVALIGLVAQVAEERGASNTPLVGTLPMDVVEAMYRHFPLNDDREERSASEQMDAQPTGSGEFDALPPEVQRAAAIVSRIPLTDFPDTQTPVTDDDIDVLFGPRRQQKPKR